MDRCCYLAGPMLGKPFFNFHEFDRLKASLETRGWTVISPADLDRARGIDATKLDPDTDWASPFSHPRFNYADALTADITAICRNVDAIALMPCWEGSRGTMCELVAGCLLGRDFICAETGEHITGLVHDAILNGARHAAECLAHSRNMVESGVVDDE